MMIMLLGKKSYEQGLVNNGAKIIIESGAYLIVDGNIKTQTESSSNGTFSLEGELKLSGNFTNDNSVTGDVFTVNSGDITFNGSTTQEVNGTAATNFGDMVLANSVEFNSVSQEALNDIDLSGGKLLVGDVDFTVNPTATITNYSTTNYIVADGVGKLSRTINDGETVFFPVGSSTRYAPVTITQAVGADDGNFKVRVVDNVLLYATSGSAIEDNKKYVNKTWFIESTASNLNLDIELNWTAADHMNGFDPLNCYISHYNSADSVWDFSDQWGTSANENSGIYSITRSGVTSLSPFTVGDESSGTLPVQLVSLSGKVVGQDAQIFWETASEINNRGFHIQKMNSNGEFVSICFVEGNGNANILHDYIYLDRNAFENSNEIQYYRLAQEDFDGHIEFSKVIGLNSEDENTLIAYPNPAKDRLYFESNETINQIDIINPKGQLVKRLENTDNSVNLSDLAPGVYYIVFHANATVYRKKIIKT